MLEISPSSTPSPFDPRSIDALTDAELDALPFGVIGLDAQGFVLRYNLYESRLARLDRSQVLGRNFFDEIARCTRGDAFQGRFARLVEAGPGASPERFEFVFDFAFGAQEVSVEMVRSDAPLRVYLLINRMRLRPPRPSFPREDLAVLQAALAPDEGALGVRRDAVDRRVIEVEWSMLSALRATCDRLAPESWSLFCSEWGVAWGRRLAVDLEGVALEQLGKNLPELPMTTFVTLLSDHMRERGWGKVDIDDADITRGMLSIRVARSALAEAARPGARSTGTGAFACPLLAGCLAAALSHVASRRIVVREVECAARGAARCEMIAVGPGRKAALERALAGGLRGVDAVRAAIVAASGEANDDTPASELLARL